MKAGEISLENLCAQLAEEKNNSLFQNQCELLTKMADDNYENVYQQCSLQKYVVVS